MEIFQGGFLVYILAINIVAFIITAFDKVAAINRWRRISERNLMLLALFGGSMFMFATMLIIRHKTKHNKFMVGIPLIIAMQAVLLVVIDKIVL